MIEILICTAIFIIGFIVGRSSKRTYQAAIVSGDGHMVVQSGNVCEGDIVGGDLYLSGNGSNQCEYCGASK